jgi:hypothetical protein
VRAFATPEALRATARRLKATAIMTRVEEIAAAQADFIRRRGITKYPPRRAALSSSRRECQDDVTLPEKPPRFRTKRKRK